MRYPAIFAALLLPLAAQDSAHLKNIQQLTSGGQNAEAYWSPDGKRLVFQSTREPYKCDHLHVSITQYFHGTRSFVVREKYGCSIRSDS